jgi:hypothetical protein
MHQIRGKRRLNTCVVSTYVNVVVKLWLPASVEKIKRQKKIMFHPGSDGQTLEPIY